MSQCRDCSLPIRWVEMEDTRKLVPVDPGVDDTGTVATTDGGGADGKTKLTGYVVSTTRPLRAGYKLRRAHHGLCAEITGKAGARRSPATATAPEALF